jgi:hypothetical protein
MQGRIAGIVTFGLMSFLLIGAAGAASDSYFETTQLRDTHKVACADDPMSRLYSVMGTPNCSVHRVSPTYGRQMMANNLSRDRDYQD